MREAFRGGWPFGHPPNMDFELNWRSPQADGLVLWLPFGVNRSTGIRHVDRVRSLSFAEVNTPIWAVDERGWMLEFDGASTEGLLAALTPVTTTPLSLCAWARPTDFATDQALVNVYAGSQHRWTLQVRGTAAGDVVCAYVRSGLIGTAFSSAGWSASSFWGHACAVYPDNNNQIAYFNGGNKGTSADARAPDPATGVSIAYRPDAEYYTGRISDARVYNRALSDAEVFEHHRSPWELYAPRVRFWPGFADGCVTTVTVTETATVTVTAQV